MPAARTITASVVILGKTRMGCGVCVGGAIEATGLPVRLLPRNGICHKQSTPFRIGEVWEMSLRPRPGLDPPHTEDHDEWGAKRAGEVPDLFGFITRMARPHIGEPPGLFGGLLRFRSTGSAYLPKVGPRPPGSIAFWQTPRALVHAEYEGRHRYRLAGQPPLTVTYVGFEPPLPVIPAGSIVRLSLARWWANPNTPAEGEVCSLQLSGWFTRPRPLAPVSVPVGIPDEPPI
jgi:hypothetical protein